MKEDAKEYFTNQYMTELAKARGIQVMISECTGNEELKAFLIVRYYDQLYNVLDYGLKMHGVELEDKDGNLQYCIPLDYNSELYEMFIGYTTFKKLDEAIKLTKKI